MLKDHDISQLSSKDLADLEMTRMEKNCWAVCREVALRIDESPGPHCNMKGFVTKARDQQFFHDKEYVDKYFVSQSKIKKAKLPGHHYYSKLETFIDQHVVCGQKYMEYVRDACVDAQKDNQKCVHCRTGWRGPVVHRVP